MEKIVDTEKLSISYDASFKKYTLTIYDKFGHYIDETELTSEDMNELCSALKKVNLKGKK